MPNTYVALEGGLDLETPPLEARPGSLLEGLNCYESVKGGYTTIAGYERFDGGPSPAEAAYYRVVIEDWQNRADAVATTVGSVVTVGSLSGTVVYRKENYDSTAIVLVLAEVAGDNPLETDYPIAFDTGANVVSALQSGDPEFAWEDTTADAYRTYAQDYRRDQIDPVPGTGQLRGVAQLRGDVYAWRDDGSDNLQCFRANSGAWDAMPYARVARVDTAGLTDEAAYGDVCNSGNDIIVGIHPSYDTSGTEVTDELVYVIKRVSGSDPTGITRDSDSADLGTVLAVAEFEPEGGGRVSYVNHNFYARPDSYSMYFADGVNCAMWINAEHDVIQPISADYLRLPEVCKHVIPFNQRLFISTTGGTFLTSLPGEPDKLDGFLGAQEVGVGDEITGFAATSSENLAIFTRQRTFAFSGNSAENWKKRLASENSGALDGCIAQIDDVFSSDDRGITQLSRVDALGGFDAGTVTDDIQSLFGRVSSDATCATTLRKLNQMRFFYGARFLILSRVPYNANGNEGIRYGITEGFYPLPVLTVSTGETAEGQERTLFGSEDGYVYWMGKGTSFDGAELDSIISLHYHHLNRPMRKKRFQGIEIEAKTTAASTCDVFYYMDDGRKAFDPRTLDFLGAPGTFDVSLFNEAVFDSVPLVRPKMKLRGTGYNLQLSFYRKSAHEPQMTLTGYTMRYKLRGQTPL